MTIFSLKGQFLIKRTIFDYKIMAIFGLKLEKFLLKGTI
jgi:hypothetical protein